MKLLSSRALVLLTSGAVLAAAQGCSPASETTDPTTVGAANGGNGSSGTQNPSSGTESGSGGNASDVSVSVGDGPASSSTGNPVGEVTSITIDPPEVLLEVVNGELPEAVTFTATATYDSGETVDFTDGVWSFDRIDIGGINAASGVLAATGNAGGVGTVTLTSGEVTGTATVTVRLELSSDPEGIDQGIKDAFEEASAVDPLVTSLLYPYDATVFPRGLTGPTLQWDGGGATDIYKITATSPTFEFVGWQTIAPPARFAFPAVDADVWKLLTDSTSGDITVEVQRYDAATSTAYLPVDQTWTIAPSVLTGTVYFWEVNNGNVVRLKPGDTAPEDFLDRGGRCVACHSAAAQGSRIIAAYDGDVSPWGVWDAAEGDSLYDSNQHSGFTAISPDGELVAWGQSDAPASLTVSRYDSTAALGSITPTSGWPVHPAWSKDGTKIAFASRTDGNWLEFFTSNLWISDVDPVSGVVTNPHLIVANDPGNGLGVVTFPTFSPDSSRIAFLRSNAAETRGARGEIWMANADGTNQVRLDALNGSTTLQDEQAQATFEPTFLPVTVGGYSWLIVVSERMYGNTLTSRNNSTDYNTCSRPQDNPKCRQKQLWVAAIDNNAPAGTDPSHPAFWLPGQSLTNHNMRGEWVLSPCKQLGDECSAGFDCCEGFCTENDDGVKVCSEGGGSCSQAGEACETATDCCDETLECIGGFCAQEEPPGTSSASGPPN